MVVGPEGKLALPWLAGPLASALGTLRGHATLVVGSEGVGVLPFVLSLAQSWLCEADPVPRLSGPCGQCASCRLVQSRVHPDLQVLLSERLRREHGWLLGDDRPEGDEAKRKPSKQIRVDEVRGVIEWVFKTSARGRGKVVVLHPAEALNSQAANALLKSLEEPPEGTRIVLSCSDPALLLPTVRSRCQQLSLATPAPDVALAWLAAQGVAQPEVLLAACSGRPLDARALVQDGVLARHWADLPAGVAHAQVAALQGWPLPRALDALNKLCHDAMAVCSGASERYYPKGSVTATATMPALREWSLELARVARHAEHPWNEGLMLDALVAAAARAMNGSTATRVSPRQRLDTLTS